MPAMDPEHVARIEARAIASGWEVLKCGACMEIWAHDCRACGGVGKYLRRPTGGVPLSHERYADVMGVE